MDLADCRVVAGKVNWDLQEKFKEDMGEIKELDDLAYAELTIMMVMAMNDGLLVTAVDGPLMRLRKAIEKGIPLPEVPWPFIGEIKYNPTPDSANFLYARVYFSEPINNLTHHAYNETNAVIALRAGAKDPNGDRNEGYLEQDGLIIDSMTRMKAYCGQNDCKFIVVKTSQEGSCNE